MPWTEYGFKLLEHLGYDHTSVTNAAEMARILNAPRKHDLLRVDLGDGNCAWVRPWTRSSGEGFHTICVAPMNDKFDTDIVPSEVFFDKGWPDGWKTAHNVGLYSRADRADIAHKLNEKLKGTLWEGTRWVWSPKMGGATIAQIVSWNDDGTPCEIQECQDSDPTPYTDTWRALHKDDSGCEAEWSGKRDETDILDNYRFLCIRIGAHRWRAGRMQVRQKLAQEKEAAHAAREERERLAAERKASAKPATEAQLAARTKWAAAVQEGRKRKAAERRGEVYAPPTPSDAASAAENAAERQRILAAYKPHAASDELYERWANAPDEHVIKLLGKQYPKDD